MPATVLVADDDEMFRELVTEILTQGGYAVVRAEDGQAALDALRQSSVDLLLADLRMPGLDGLEVLRQLRAGEVHALVAVDLQIHQARKPDLRFMIYHLPFTIYYSGSNVGRL